MIVQCIDFFRNRMKMTVRLSLAVLTLLVVVDGIPGLIDKSHAHTGPERWFGFWAIFGFGACALIIFVSKWYGHLGIMTREDFYDD